MTAFSLALTGWRRSILPPIALANDLRRKLSEKHAPALSEKGQVNYSSDARLRRGVEAKARPTGFQIRYFDT
jgi:hypothetical protein